jgi:putative ABC transport system permease protein
VPSLRALLWRLGALFRGRRQEEDLAAEVQAHLDLLTEENLRRGLGSEQARSVALRAFGSVEQAKELWRDQRSLAFLDALVIDLRFAFRLLRKSPGFAAVAILTFALGIGANTAIFTVVQEAVLNPLPIKRTERLVWLANAWPDSPVGVLFNVQYQVWLQQSHSFERMAAYATQQLTLTGAGPAERLEAGRVSAQFFTMLGIAPVLGRDFAAGEDQPRAPRVTILGYAIWRDRFGANRAILGRAVVLDGEPYEVVGILPRDFRFLDHASAEIYVPYLLPGGTRGTGLRIEPVKAIAWLKPGVTPRSAEAELAAILERSKNDYPLSAFRMSGAPVRPHVVSPWEWRTWQVGSAPFVLAVAVALVLLMACANVANLQVVRVLERAQELAVRTAVGAGRMRLVRQLVTESALLALLGGIAGVALAFWGTRALRWLAPPNLDYLRSVKVNATTLLFTLVIALGSGFASGLLPALAGTRGGIRQRLQEGGARSTSGRPARRLHEALSVLAITVALVLLTGSGLLVRSFLRLTAKPLGMEPKKVLSLRVSLPVSRYGRPDAQRVLGGRLLSEIRALPGVSLAALTTDEPLPWQGPGCYELGVETHRPSGKDDKPHACEASVSADYFRAMGIPVLAGRAFNERDGGGGPPAAIVNQALQRSVFGGHSALGERVRTRGEQWLTIVGVVGETHLPGASPRPDSVVVYQPFGQADSSAMINARMLESAQGQAGARQWLPPATDLTLVIRTQVAPGSLAPAVRARLASIDPDLAIYDLATMEQRISRSVAAERFSMLLLSLFAIVALVLALVGVYEVGEYGARRRTQEIGIRLALGAAPARILRMVLMQTVRAAVLGLALGTAAALFLTRFLQALLFGVPARDPLTFLASSVIIFVVSLVAGYLPARRAMRIDPAVALRYQ